MYVNKFNRFRDVPAISDFIRRYSFALLITQGKKQPWATHLPLELETNLQGQHVLWGHIAKANRQWEHFADNTPVLAIFQGPHHYISSSWYNHVNVPTWNYLAVHVYGTLTLSDDATVREHLRRMVHKYEAISDKPVSLETMPEPFVKKEMKGLVGFEIAIDKIEGNWKLSQNRDDENYKNIIAELEKLSTQQAKEVSGEMKKMRHL